MAIYPPVISGKRQGNDPIRNDRFDALFKNPSPAAPNMFPLHRNSGLFPYADPETTGNRGSRGFFISWGGAALHEHLAKINEFTIYGISIAIMIRVIPRDSLES